MSLFLDIHPDNPQPRLINQAVDAVVAGGVIVYPTDSCYAIGCRMGNKKGVERILQLRDLKESHLFSLICRDISEISTYATVTNPDFRLVKSMVPGPFTFVLKATREVPRRLQDPKRKTIGIRIPDNPICQALTDALGEPLMSTTLILPGDDHPPEDAEEIRDRLDKLVDVIIDGGFCSVEPSTVLDLTEQPPKVVRQGKGEVPPGVDLG